jgi:hypothetical protein
MAHQSAADAHQKDALAELVADDVRRLRAGLDAPSVDAATYLDTLGRQEPPKTVGFLHARIRSYLNLSGLILHSTSVPSANAVPASSRLDAGGGTVRAHCDAGHTPRKGAGGG